MMIGRRGFGKKLRRLLWRHGTGICRLAQDPHEAVLGDRARRPPVPNLLMEPPSRLPMLNVIVVKQGLQDVDVQQGAHVDSVSTPALRSEAG